MLLAPKKRQSKRKRKRAHWVLVEKNVHGHNIPLGLTPDKRAEWIANALLDITRQIEDHGLKLRWLDLPSRIAGATHDEIKRCLDEGLFFDICKPTLFVQPRNRDDKDKWVNFTLVLKPGKRAIKRVFYKGHLLSAGQLAELPENVHGHDRQVLAKRIFNNNYSAHMALSEPTKAIRSHPKTRNQKKAPIGCELDSGAPETPAK